MNAIRLILLCGLTLGFISRLGAQTPTPPPLRGDFDDALLREWVPPEYPPAARQAKLEGEVVVEFVVEADGHVSQATVNKSSDERFNASALAAVQRWVFVSATFEGKPAASGLRASVVFKLAQSSQKKNSSEPPAGLRITPLPVTKAKLKVSPAPDYPPELALRSLPGKVVLEFSVGTDGKATAPKVLWASHAAFVGEALRVLEKYEFEPAHQGPLLLNAPATQGEVGFDSEGLSGLQLLGINQISVIEPERFRQLPRPTMLSEAVYPRELLLTGESGSAAADFTVNEHGAVADVLLKDASRPEFGAALIATVETWHFDPALFTTGPAEAKMTANYKFAPPTAGAGNRLMLALQPGGAGIGGAGGLDERLRPIWRVSPVYPQALRIEKPAGKALIEFIIDREGRARLPRVVSATHVEFGWAAAAAINQWVFAPPLRAGQPVDVKVSIPFDFPSPTD